MKTEILEKCLLLLRWTLEYPGNTLKEELICFDRSIVPLFTKELKQNLLLKPTSQEKKDLIKYYIDELHDAASDLDDYDQLIFDDELGELWPPKGCDSNDTSSDIGDNDQVILDDLLGELVEPIGFPSAEDRLDINDSSDFDNRLDSYEQASLNEHFFYALLFNEIQIICNKYIIPFKEICDELQFPISTIKFGSIMISAGRSVSRVINDSFEIINREEAQDDDEKDPDHEVDITETKRLKTSLAKYGFNNIQKVKDLSVNSRDKLIEFLVTNDLPYKVAMLDYLGFIKFLEFEFGATKTNLHRNLADILSSTTRAVKGNINVLNPISKEDRMRFTTHLYRETVKNDYQKLE
ncbi:MAG: hypothetical protein NTU98_03185 [Bacteroidetes bacterium]|nr:hypothetical protein [Bacteroidota bacterium]